MGAGGGAERFTCCRHERTNSAMRAGAHRPRGRLLEKGHETMGKGLRFADARCEEAGSETEKFGAAGPTGAQARAVRPLRSRVRIGKPRVRIPRAESALEERLWYLLLAEQLPVWPEREYRFHPTRKWRFDFAFVEAKLAIECEGGIWQGGRHTRGAGFEKDCEKMNAAAVLGWRVLRFTPGLLKRDPVRIIRQCLTLNNCSP